MFFPELLHGKTPEEQEELLHGKTPEEQEELLHGKEHEKQEEGTEHEKWEVSIMVVVC